MLGRAVRVAQREYGGDNGPQLASIGHRRKSFKFRAIGLEDEKRIAHALILRLLASGRDGHEPTAGSKDIPRAGERVAADRVEDHVHVANDVFEALRFIIKRQVGAEAANKIEIVRWA